MKTRTFIKRSRISAPVEAVFQWHANPGALERLSPPWDPIQVIERSGGIHKGARVSLKMHAGPISYRWEAEHTDYEENRFFRDRQVRGPFACWIHSHGFESDGTQACVIQDHIEYALPVHPFGNFIGDFIIPRQLQAIFDYRHETLSRDMALHLPVMDQPRRRILISGASGVIGSALIPFLTTGGHQVVRLQREKQRQTAGSVYWNPVLGELNPEALSGIDTVIHLAGEHIGEGWWTAEKKRRILESRTLGTSLIAKTIGRVNPRPKVLVCASAIGYYGHRGDAVMTEQDAPGRDFISEVCTAWEAAARPAVESGIRVVFLRIGVALTPVGGALQRLLLPFKAGIGGKLGDGRQYMSWIGIDDVIGAIHHVMFHTEIEGPVNVVSPNPATNREFTETLGKVLSRPTPITVPAWGLKLVFGQMGKEVPLSSTRVLPEKLIASGYRFRNPDLEGALRHLLGKTVGS